MRKIYTVVLIVTVVMGCQRKTPVFISSSVSISPSPGAYNHPISVSMTGGPGMAIFYSINGQPVRQYSAPFTVHQQGTYDIRYGASDGLFLPVRWSYAVYTIDTVPPAVSLSPPPDTYYAPVRVTITSDKPASIYVSTSASPFSTYTSPIPVPLSEYFTVQAYAVDAAGNSSSITGGTYLVDLPSIRIVSPADNSVLPSNIPIPFSATAYDVTGTLTGGDVTWFTSDNTFLGYGTATSGSFSDGTYTIYAATVNAVGISNTASVRITASSSLFSSLTNPNILSDVCSDGSHLYGTGNGGLAIFDMGSGSPVSFLTVDQGLPTNDLSLCACDNGSLYISSDRGLVISSSTGITVSDTSNSAIVSDNIGTLYPVPGGSLWIGSPAGAMYLDGSGFHQWPVPLDITYSFLMDMTDSTMWFGGFVGLAHSTSTGWVTYTTSDSGLPSDAALSLTQDTAGDIAVAGYPSPGSPGGVGVFTPTTNEWLTLTTANGLLSDTVSSVLYDQDNRLVIGTSSGVSVFTNSSIAQDFTTQVPVLFGTTMSGTTWLATSGQGILKYDGSSVSALSIPGNFLVDNDVHAVCFKPDGTVFVGTDRGINGTGGMGIALTITSSPVHALEYADGCLWAGTASGLLGACTPGGTMYLQGTKVNTILMPWVGTNSGLYYSTGSGFSDFTYSGTSGGLLSDTVNGLAYDDSDNILYIGTQEGLSGFDGTQFYPAPAPYTWVGGMASAKGGGVWMLTNMGVCLYRDSVSTCYLLSQSPTGVAVDGTGSLWVSTGSGFYRYDGSTWLFYPPTLPLPDSFINTIAVAPDGTKYIGTVAGLGIYKGN
ncbi:MAG: hypothetical protein M1491_08955 [Deltaproteobacteria bacterium]|nr:hypothetical protein [Deltaproteobacteria bacterium]